MIGLFYLFIAHSYLRDCIYKWTKDVLKEKWNVTDFSFCDFKQYIGLEIAMSFNSFHTISDYWSNKMFAGNQDFKDQMGRDRFKRIRGCLTLHAPFETQDYHNRAIHDPLYYSRSFLNRFITRITKVAVPYGAAAFDEATMSTKARTRSRTYMPNKPSKYGIRFYSLVSHTFSYLFSFFDNGSGNLADVPAALRYTELFCELKTPLEKTFADLGTTDDLKTASALWTAQIGHMTQKLPSCDLLSKLNCRYVFMNNFYTRHKLARTISKFSDNDVKVIGTVRGNFIDGATRENVMKVIADLKDKPCNSWYLVRELEADKTPPLKKEEFNPTLWVDISTKTAHPPQEVHVPKKLVILSGKTRKSHPFTPTIWLLRQILISLKVTFQKQ